jgi:hypothetical protein
MESGIPVGRPPVIPARIGLSPPPAVEGAISGVEAVPVGVVVPIVIIVIVVVEIVVVVIVIVVITLADVGTRTEPQPEGCPEADTETRGVYGMRVPVGPGQTDPDAVEKAQMQRE